MEPFEVVCPACQKALRVKQPELIGKRVACPQCKEKFVIERPAEGSLADAPAPELPAAAGPVLASSPADAAPFGAGPAFAPSEVSAGSALRKQAKSNNLLILGGGGASIAVIILIVVIRSFVSSSNQAEIRKNLSAADRKRLEELEASGKRVVLEEKKVYPRPVTPDPVPRKPTKEMPRVELAETLHGRVQDLKRAHKMATAVTSLAAALQRLSSQYRSEEITQDDYVAKLTEMATTIDETERTLVQKALTDALLLEQPDLDADKLAKFVAAYDQAVLAARAKDWKLDDAARQQVHDVVKKTLEENKLGGKKADLEELLVKFSEEYY